MTLIECPGLPEESYKSCRRLSFWTSPQILQKMMKVRGRTHLGTCKQTLSKHKAQEQQPPRKRFLTKTKYDSSQSSNNMFASSHTENSPETGPDWGSDDTALEIQLARTLSRKPADTCMLLSPVRPEKGARKFLNVECPWKRENSLIQLNRRRSRIMK